MGMFECPHDQFPTLGKLIENGYPVFDDSWATFIPEHKKELCDKIVRHYYFREICCPTPDRFRHYINAQLQQIMPYYNQMYQSELIKFNPMLNHAIERHGRSIENLLKAVENSSVKAGKNIRDVNNVSTGYTESTSKSDQNHTNTLDKTINNVYNKDGTDDAVTDNVENTVTHATSVTNEKENINRDIKEVTESDASGHSDTVGQDILDASKVIAGDKQVHTGTDINSNDTNKGTVTDDGTGSSDSSGAKNYVQNTDGTLHTTDVNSLTENTSANARKDYADTPQIQLSSSAGSDGLGPTGVNWTARTDYLTNVTWDTSSSNHKMDSTENIDTKTTENKKYDETNSDKTNTTNKNTQTTDMTKTGVEKKVQDEQTNYNETETNNSTTDKKSTTDSTDTVNKTVVTDDDTVKTSDSSTITDSNTDVVGEETYADKWKEQGNHDTVEKSVDNGEKHNVSAAQGKQTAQGAEQETASAVQSTDGKESTERTVDTGTTNIDSGFMNISASKLLEQFRKTFLNVDQMIISDLEENFMQIF